MALSVFAGWQTQPFMTYAAGPVFATTSILMSRDAFHLDERVAKVVDIAPLGLQNTETGCHPTRGSLF
jgi:hypothetical protein